MLAKRTPGPENNNLNILVRRYGLNNSHRELHGALLELRILADVVLVDDGGQTVLGLANNSDWIQARG